MCDGHGSEPNRSSSYIAVIAKARNVTESATGEPDFVSASNHSASTSTTATTSTSAFPRSEWKPLEVETQEQGIERGGVVLA